MSGAEKRAFRWRSADGGLVALLGLVTATGSMTTDVYVPAMPALAHALDASPAAIQATLSIYLVGQAIGQLLWGPISDRFGRRMPLIAGLGIYVAGSLLAAAAPSLWLLLAGRLVQALGTAAGTVVVRAIVTDRFEGITAARVQTMLMQILGLAAIVAPLLGGAILQASSWRGIFLLLAAIGGSCLLAMARLLRESHPPEKRAASLAIGQRRVYATLLTQPGFVLLCLASSATLASMFALIMGSSFVFIDAFGWSPFAYALLYMGTSVVFLICGWFNDLALKRWPLNAILWPAIVVQTAAGLATLALSYVGAGAQWWLAVMLLVLIGNLGFIHGNLIAAAMDRARASAGVGASLLGVAQYGISAMAAGVAGAIASNALFSMAGTALLFTLVATATFVAAVTLKPRQP